MDSLRFPNTPPSASPPYPRHRTIERLPNELLLQIASYLPQDDLSNFLKSNPTNSRLHLLQRITFGSKYFAPWRRRWSMFRKACAAAQCEAADTALRNNRILNPTIVSSGGVRPEKGPKELHFESVMQNMFECYGFRPPPRARPNSPGPVPSTGPIHSVSSAAPEEGVFPIIDEGTLFMAIANTLPREALPADRRYLRLKKLECCDIALLRKRLEEMTEVPFEMARGHTPAKFNDLAAGDEAEQAYKLITAYLLYTSLKPSQVFGAISSATTPAARWDVLREEHHLCLMEYFCFLGLWMDLWEAQFEMLRYPEGEHFPVIRFTGDYNRRVLRGRLKECLRIGFAPCRPNMGSESVAMVLLQQPASPGGRSGNLSQRPTDSPIGRTGRTGFSRCASWGSSGDETSSTLSPMTPAHGRHVPSVGDQTAASSLTDEQREVVDTDVGPGEMMKVKAYAGTGKTRSLVEYAKKRPRKRFLYVAFNSSAAADARKRFAPNVDCRTVHALALKVLHCVAPEVHGAIGGMAMSIPTYWGNRDIVELLNLDSTEVITGALCNPASHYPPGRRVPSPVRRGAEGHMMLFPTATSVAATVKWALENFWNSTDQLITGRCLPDRMITQLGLRFAVILQWAKDIWTAILHGRAPWLPHDAYLKLLHIRGQESGADRLAFGAYDIIMFDEAQDANPCMAAIVLRQQSMNKSGLIVVGDPYQRIYGFRGAGNEAFDDEKFPSAKTCYLTWSFRFGDAVARVANTILRALGEPVPVNGVRKQDTVYTPYLYDPPTSGRLPSAPFTVIFRKNSTLIQYALSFALLHPKHKLYLHTKRDFQKSSLFNSLRDAHHLYHRGQASHNPLKVWKSWVDLKAHVEAESMDNGGACAGDNPVLSLVVSLESEISSVDFIAHLVKVEANVLDGCDKHLADVTLVTAHQAKGLEWDRVQLANDFKPDYALRMRLASVKHWREEACILYVALTRARKELIIPHVVQEWFAMEYGVERLFVRSRKHRTDCPYCVSGTKKKEGCEVLLCVEPVLPAGSFSRSTPVDGSSGDHRQGKPLMCRYCAERVVRFFVQHNQVRRRLQEVGATATGRSPVLAGHEEPVESGTDVVWLPRKSEQERDAETETGLVGRWVCGVWEDWRYVAQRLMTQNDPTEGG